MSDQPNQTQSLAPVGVDALVRRSVRCAVADKIKPMEILGDVSKHGGEWRALVAVTPSGPMILMGFTVSI